ncbi:MAG: putative bifunctional diguanylate cyclase/phosphodiesterase [Gammaproteobacteria bacterium]
MRTLLLIDSNSQVLQILVEQLQGDGYEILTATTSRQALTLLMERDVGVVISDQEMPDMCGIELLRQIRKTHPNTVRILLTACADVKAVSQAVNEGAAYKYFIKPWDSEELRGNLREAFQFHDLLLEKEQLDQEIRHTNTELRQINEALQQRLTHQSRQLIKISQYDTITGLPNRLLFTDRLKQALVRARSDNTLLAVVVVGLDRFMLINETLGQSAGDQLLHAVAELLESCVRDSDTVARFGGDEFIMMLTDLHSVEEVNAALEILRNALAEPFDIGRQEIFISSGIGICMYPYDGSSDEELIKHANTAMHHAKQLGEGNYKFYAEEMNLAASEWLKLENDLRHALKRREFELYYQPQYTIDDHRVVGVEALIRWQHPEKGLVSPAKFLPILEKTGLMVPVGEWVFREACRQYQEWQLAGVGIDSVSINLSVRQFGSDYLLSMMEKVLRELNLDPRHNEIRLEVTEHLVIEDFETTIKLLRELKEMGFHIAIDDFGTGYASLHYLTRFPVSSLKIDRTFIDRLDSNESDANLVKAIIAMAHSLGLNVTAEGVETGRQLDFLRRHQCDEAQGYLLSRPCPADEIRTTFCRPQDQAS